MNFEKIDSNQYTLLIILYILGGTILSNIGGGAGSDIWLVYLVGLVVGILFAAMYYRILRLHNFCSVPELMKRVFGYWGGKVFCFIYALYFLFRTDVVGQIVTEMATDLLMHDAPRKLTVGVLLFTTLYACHKGLGAIGRSSQVICILIGICLLPFLLTAFSSEAFSVKNLYPILTSGYQSFWTRAAAVSITPYTEIGLFAIYAYHVDHNQKRLVFKRMVMGMTISTGFLILIGIINLSILGKYLVASLKYPFYNAMMLTGIHGVLERLDPLAVIIVITSGFYKVTLLFYCWLEMLGSVFHKIHRNWIIVFTAALIFFGTPEMTYLYDKFWSFTLPFEVMPLFQLVFPVLIWLVSEVKFYFKRKEELQNAVSQV